MSRRIFPTGTELDSLLGVLLHLRMGNRNRLPGFTEPILIFLGTRAERPVKIVELSERLGLGQSRASRLCAALKRAGLVEITTAAEYRRASWVRLSQAGWGLVDECANALRTKALGDHLHPDTDRSEFG